MHKLGTGILTWDSDERITDRYGSVYLLWSLDSKRKVSLSRVAIDKRGRLVAVVEETRSSTHVGDWFHGVYPETPQKGERIILGKGTLFFKGNKVGLHPEEKRATLWLDIRALYRAHEQTVTLYFEEREEEWVM